MTPLYCWWVVSYRLQFFSIFGTKGAVADVIVYDISGTGTELTLFHGPCVSLSSSSNFLSKE